MRLKKLELSGFKSFAKTASLEFPAPISAIVGPNGSGKSNVAEAMRWVLGEQSMKSLRGKKGEDLIFNGSQTAPRLGKASVALVFDNRDKILPVDFDEVKITRKVYRDGANEYFLNNTQVRLKDVIELLGNIGLGASSHHIISQGEADRILNASIKERRQMIEDALGLKIYQLKKTESERKLEKTEENIRQVEALKKEIQPHLRFLQKQVEKAREALHLKDELKNLYREYFSREEDWIKKESGRIAAEKAEPEAQMEKIEREMPARPEGEPAERGESEKIKSEADALRRETRSVGESMDELRAKRSSFERELGRFEGMIEMEENRRKREGGEAVPAARVRDFAGKITERVDAGLSGGADAMKAALEGVKNLLADFMANAGFKAAVPASELDNLKNKKGEIFALLEKVNEEEKILAARRRELSVAIGEKEEKLRSLEREKYEMGARLRELKGILSNLRVQEDNVRLQREEFEREKLEAAALLGDDVLNFPPAAEREPFSRQERENGRRRIERLKIRLEDSGAIGEDALKEYEEVKNRDEFFEKELGDLTRAADSLGELLKELHGKIDSSFKEGVEKINKEFQEFFIAMFGGGRAELKVVAPKARKKKNPELGEIEISDEEEEESRDEGVDVAVSLPKKRVNSLDMLSGGERALTSIALLFAMSQVNPPPFLVLDETDAALDEANSQRYGAMLQKLSERTQLVLITHNREIMRQAGVLYGVTMGSDSISKLLSIKFTEAEKYTA